MPFQSEKQRRYLWANEPEIARDWTDTYGSGIAKALGGRIGFQEGKGPGWAAQQILNKKNQELKNLQAQKAQLEQMGMDTTEIDQGIQSIENFVQGHIEKHNLDPVEKKEKRGLSNLPASSSVELKDLLQKDPFYQAGMIDLKNVKPFEADPDFLARNVKPGQTSSSAASEYGYLNLDKLKQEKAYNLGYTYPGSPELYVSNLDKPTMESAATVTHEGIHQAMPQSLLDAAAKDAGSAFGPLTSADADYARDEMMTRYLENQIYGDETAPFEGWMGEVTPSDLDFNYITMDRPGQGALGIEGAKKILAQSGDPFLKKIAAKAHKNIEARGLQERGLANISPHAGMMPPAQYGKGQTQDDKGSNLQNWFKGLFSPKSIMKGASSYLANKAGLGIFAGLPGMALSMFGGKGGFKGRAINPATQQFMQNYGVGRDPRTGRMTSGPFAGQNLPGSSLLGSKTPKEMAQKWVDKYGDKQYTTKKQQQKQQQIKNIATMNQGPAGQIPGGNGGVNGGTGGGMGKGQDPGGGTAGSPFNRGGLAALWPR